MYNIEKMDNKKHPVSLCYKMVSMVCYFHDILFHMHKCIWLNNFIHRLIMTHVTGTAHRFQYYDTIGRSGDRFESYTSQFSMYYITSNTHLSEMRAWNFVAVYGGPQTRVHELNLIKWSEKCYISARNSSHFSYYILKFSFPHELMNIQVIYLSSLTYFQIFLYLWNLSPLWIFRASKRRFLVSFRQACDYLKSRKELYYS